MTLPQRKHIVEIKIGADSWDDVIGALNDIYLKFTEGQFISSVAGGYSASWIITCKDNPDMTHDKYFEEISKIRKQDKKEYP